MAGVGHSPERNSLDTRQASSPGTWPLLWSAEEAVEVLRFALAAYTSTPARQPAASASTRRPLSRFSGVGEVS